ncbi:MAG: hypothetical protein NVSMB59_18360 [Vulcanimicrobiaceae bacterium]
MTTDIDADTAALARALRDLTVRVVDAGGRGGSGVVWDRDGTIVTNAHVVRGPYAQIVWSDGRDERAPVVRRDDASDLAQLRGGALANGAAVAHIRTDAMRPGELAVAVGNPHGETGAFTAGLVRASNPRWVTTSVRLAPGNSGGPLADAVGRIVGINSMVAGDLGLAIPSAAVIAFVRAAPPRLGVAVARANLRVAGEDRAALVVTDVAPHSVAARSGLALGDAIVAIDGAPLQPTHVVPMLASARALGIVRDGRAVTISLDRRADRAA